MNLSLKNYSEISSFKALNLTLQYFLIKDDIYQYSEWSYIRIYG